VAELSHRIGVLSKDDYERLKRVAEEARAQSAEAQVKLDAHIQEHGCGHNGEVAA